MVRGLMMLVFVFDFACKMHKGKGHTGGFTPKYSVLWWRCAGGARGTIGLERPGG